MLTSVGSAKHLRVTFLTPNQDPTSGGAEAIERFSQLCASRMNVRLGVELHEPRVLPGIQTFSSRELSNRDLPPSDALVLPVESRRIPLGFPPHVGTPILLFQGYGTSDNDIVAPNLKAGHPVLVTASWLLEEAEKLGARARLVRYGCDRSIFGMGPPTATRAPIVTMMTSPVPWKGTRDGSEALKRVRAELGDVEIRCFGHVKPDIPGSTLAARASRPEVARLMREAMVFVCSSWQEGFGLPGIEAMICGAAVATTDTRGSRDYAFNAETALVSPPHNPGALAHNIVRLFRDPGLRARLVERAAQVADHICPDWSTLSEPFTAALRSSL